MATTLLEERRLTVQKELDSVHSQLERNILGQFATPTLLAHEILKYANRYYEKADKIRFLDPALGTGAFYSALLKIFPHTNIERATGYEIDDNFVTASKKLWDTLSIKILNKDFTYITPISDERYNLIVCNPPYVRHHHLSSNAKKRLQTLVREELGIHLSGLSGYYCYFLLLSIKWLEANGISGWLIPSEFMDVNYGKQIKAFLTEHVQLLHIHRFSPEEAQFDDALVSSAIVWFKNSKPDINHKVLFTFGGTLLTPKIQKMISLKMLRTEKKWTRIPFTKKSNRKDTTVLRDFFDIKRGIATGDNSFFILSKEQIIEKDLPLKAFKPVLPSPRHLPETEVSADDGGMPLIERKLFVLNCDMPESEIKKRYPTLWEYLLEGQRRGVPGRYLCRNRNLWYMQEHRLPSKFYFTYIGRRNNGTKKPFRFLLNRSDAIVTNSYLILYPNAALSPRLLNNPSAVNMLWKALNDIPLESLLNEGRVYGGGLHKLEPRELGNVPADIILRTMRK